MARCEENRIASRRIARRPDPGVIVRGLTRAKYGSVCQTMRERERESQPSDRAPELSRDRFPRTQCARGHLGLACDASFRPEKRVPPTMPVLASAVWVLSSCTRTRRISLCSLPLSLFLSPSVYCHLPFIPYKPAIPDTLPLPRPNVYRV